jgi:type IV fimbrial biogenesis protein FimT
MTGMNNSTHQQRGMTLLEAMVVLAIAAILLGIAVPAFNTQIANSSRRAASVDFITGMAYARAESVKRGTEVHLRSLTGTQWWSTGWCVTVNADCSGEVIRKFDAQGVTIKSSLPAGTVFTFNSQGFLGSTSTSVSFCRDAKGKKVTVTPLGQALAQDCSCNSDSLCT